MDYMGNSTSTKCWGHVPGEKTSCDCDPLVFSSFTEPVVTHDI